MQVHAGRPWPGADPPQEVCARFFSCFGLFFGCLEPDCFIPGTYTAVLLLIAYLYRVLLLNVTDVDYYTTTATATAATITTTTTYCYYYYCGGPY